MTAALWSTSSETRTLPFSRPSGSVAASLASRTGRETVRIDRTRERDKDTVDEGGRGRANQDEVQTKVSGREAAVPESVPAPNTERLAADASGARLIIPALSLRSAVVGAPLRDAPPLDGPEPPPEELAPGPLSELRGEPTSLALSRRRRSLPLVWVAAGALVALGLLASTTETADRIAARIHLSFAADAIPAARAEQATMPVLEAVVAAPEAAPVVVAPAPAVATPEKLDKAAVKPTRIVRRAPR